MLYKTTCKSFTHFSQIFLLNLVKTSIVIQCVNSLLSFGRVLGLEFTALSLACANFVSKHVLRSTDSFSFSLFAIHRSQICIKSKSNELLT